MSPALVSTLVTISLILVFPSRGNAGEPHQPDRPATAQEIAQLIRQLESKKFRERQEASRALEAAGDGALDALRQAAEKSDDPEVRFRARRLIERIESHFQGIFSQHSGVVLGLALSPDGKYVLSAGEADYRVRLSETKPCPLITTFSPPSPPTY